jgi:hypothetical protein
MTWALVSRFPKRLNVFIQDLSKTALFSHETSPQLFWCPNATEVATLQRKIGTRIVDGERE